MPEIFWQVAELLAMFEFWQTLQETESGFPSDGNPVILLTGRKVLVAENPGKNRLPCWGEVKNFCPDDMGFIRVGKLDGEACFAGMCRELPESDVLRQWEIRRFLFEFPEDQQNALCRAKGLMSWRGQHRFCGVCQGELLASGSDSGVRCAGCGAVYYPQLAPAVIVAVTRNNGRELLLAHNRNFSANLYSVIAGFVEAGEALEDAVHREIFEECAIKVKNVRYVTSQVWPFPNSLMLAFTAEYDSGEAVADGVELSELGWFTADDHPELPAYGSVARKLIDMVFNQ